MFHLGRVRSVLLCRPTRWMSLLATRRPNYWTDCESSGSLREQIWITWVFWAVRKLLSRRIELTREIYTSCVSINFCVVCMLAQIGVFVWFDQHWIWKTLPYIRGLSWCCCLCWGRCFPSSLDDCNRSQQPICQSDDELAKKSVKFWPIVFPLV